MTGADRVLTGPAEWHPRGIRPIQRGLAERTTSTDSRDESLVAAGLEVPEAQAQTTVPAPSGGPR